MNFVKTATHGLTRYKGKVAVITASTQGMGYAIAERLAAEGAAVVICSRKADNVNSAVEKLRSKNYKVEGLVCHVSDAEQRKKLLKTAQDKFGGMDVLISIAGVNPAHGPITLLKEIGAYAVSKTALLGLTKNMASELGPENIRVNCVAPGYIDTPFANTLIRTEEEKQNTLKRIILNRAGTAEEVASTVAFLCSDEAAYITAENVSIAGGQTSRL